MKYEYKYLIPNELLEKVREYLKPYIEQDKYTPDGSNEYLVRSIYFDNNNLTSFFDKVEGVAKRKKIRIRGYNSLTEDSIVFLEIKRKINNHTQKHRFKIPYNCLGNFLDNDGALPYKIKKADVNPLNYFLYNFKIGRLKPVVLINYTREAYFSKFDKNLRITFDKEINYKPYPELNTLFDDYGLREAKPNYFILEIKFYTSYPLWLINLTRHFELQRISFSKYTVCLEDYKKHSFLFSKHFQLYNKFKVPMEFTKDFD
ncbi:MAG: polyphosphate polymerase domain-containing protein [Syntrophothermus sp.]